MPVSTVRRIPACRILPADVLRPWQHACWIFIQARLRRNVARALDLCRRIWDG
ncbi:hypothetical protein [Nonomuraea zeae]|uniref:hypothetical protein n=1 Tax=Nonomuraea zeae TaxID=1642303 RepID=UPI0014781CD6|nr:hypothetical protein [Nonomuraea zeae]